MLHQLFSWRSKLMIKYKNLVNHVYSFLSNKRFILLVDEILKIFFLFFFDVDDVLDVHVDSVFLYVLEEVWSTEEFYDLYQLILIVVTKKHVVDLEYYSSKHTTETPNILGEVIVCVFQKKLRTLVWSTRYSCVVTFIFVVDFT